MAGSSLVEPGHDERGHAASAMGSKVTRPIPEWFDISEEATPQIMQRIAASVSDLQMSIQVRSAPMLAHWFLLDTMLFANTANREGMHANALALTRQCVEAIGIIELGVCGHPEAEAMLTRWDCDDLPPGKLRAWLDRNVWPKYGAGLWTEPWCPRLCVSLQAQCSLTPITALAWRNGRAGYMALLADLTMR